MLVRALVDGVEREAEADAAASLLAVLRDEWDALGVKDACREGECGSCSVLLDGELVCSCLVPAFQADGREVRTVASLANGGLHRLQEAFLDAGAVQCGFCTPGLLVAAAHLLERAPRPGDDEIREALAGNLCRCTGYAKVVAAVRAAAETEA